MTHKNGERFSAAKAYLTPNRSRPNLEVMTDAHTTRIVFEGRRAIGVEVRHGGAVQRLQRASARCCCAPARCSRRSC